MTHGLADDRACARGGVLCCPQRTRRTCQCRRLGRERPSLCAGRLRPGSLTRGSLTPQVSARRSRRCLRRCFPRIVGVTAGTRTLVIGRLSVCARRTTLTPWPSRRSASSGAQRRARLGALRRPRAWSARGLRALTTPPRRSPEGHYVMATGGLCLDGVRTSRMSGIARVTRS